MTDNLRNGLGMELATGDVALFSKVIDEKLKDSALLMSMTPYKQVTQTFRNSLKRPTKDLIAEIENRIISNSPIFK